MLSGPRAARALDRRERANTRLTERKAQPFEDDRGDFRLENMDLDARVRSLASAGGDRPGRGSVVAGSDPGTPAARTSIVLDFQAVDGKLSELS
jgi:hypothetical protein